jgi:hypothetical protein
LPDRELPCGGKQRPGVYQMTRSPGAKIKNTIVIVGELI